MQGFPSLRKTVKTRLRKCGIFSRVFENANQLPTRHFRAMLMNELRNLYLIIQGRLSEVFQIMVAKTPKNSISLRDSDVQTFLKGKKTKIRKEKPKVTYSVTLVMAFLAAENENRQLKGLPQADFGRVPERFLRSVIIIIIIITNFYTGLKNPSVCNTVVLGEEPSQQLRIFYIKNYAHCLFL